MAEFAFVTCDVFTTVPFGGNPLAVFPEASGLDAATMQRIAGELNLSETVFVLPPDDRRALRRLRIFTPGTELPLAGHPVVGTWFVLADLGIVAPPEGDTGGVRIHQELAAGVLPVDITFEAGRPVSVAMTQPAPTVTAVANATGQVATALGLELGDLGGESTFAMSIISAGSPMLAVPIASREAPANCRPNRAALDALLDSVEAFGLYATYREPGGLVHARMFGGSTLGIIEDPATGGAAGPLAGGLAEAGLLDEHSPSFTIEQGTDMGRISAIAVEAVFADGAIETVRVSGPSVIMSRGTFAI